MAFKNYTQYIEDKNGPFFVLPNDGDYADVIFLYRDANDVVIIDAHYLSTNKYKGYAHCCGAGCPACNYGKNGIRKQDKLFIPMYNASKQKIEFWDRNPRFQMVIEQAVFKNYPNPSEYVFRITRHGESGDVNTRYEIRAISRNTAYPYEKILSDFNMSFPDSYSEACRLYSIDEMSDLFNSSGEFDNLGEYEFTPRPRGNVDDNMSFELPPAQDFNVSTPVYSAPPENVPVADGIDAAELVPTSDPVEGDDSNDALDDVAF